VFFLAIAAVYEYANRSFSAILFWIHAILSVIPLLSLAIWPFYFTGNTYDIEAVLIEFKTLKILEWFFIITQAIFIVILIRKKNMVNQLRTI
jgi:hypothetical protein